MNYYERRRLVDEATRMTEEQVREALKRAQGEFAAVEADKAYTASLAKAEAAVRAADEAEKAAREKQDAVFAQEAVRLGLWKPKRTSKGLPYTNRLISALERAVGTRLGDEKTLARSQYDNPLREALDRYVTDVVCATKAYKAAERALEKAEKHETAVRDHANLIRERFSTAREVVGVYSNRLQKIEAAKLKRTKGRAVTEEEKRIRAAERERVEQRRESKKKLDAFATGALKLDGFPSKPDRFARR